MITYTTASIFDSPALALVNPVNTVGVMGAGLALEFKRRYPTLFEFYKWACRDHELEIGRLVYYNAYGKIIVLFPTKQDWRSQSRIEYIEEGLRSFACDYIPEGIPAVSFPMLGCGLGGLNWGDVKPLMEKYLQDVDIPVYIHEVKQ